MSITYAHINKSPPRSISTENHDDVDREDLYAWD